MSMPSTSLRSELPTDSERIKWRFWQFPQNLHPRLRQRLESNLGVAGILNFAPVSLPNNRGPCIYVDVDLAVELQRLAFAVVNSDGSSSS